MDQKRKRRQKRRPAHEKRHLRSALLLFLCVITLAVPLLTTGGTAFSESVTAQAADGAYDDLALELAGATAFDDARRTASKGEASEGDEDAYDVFIDNLRTLVSGNYWGNVGIFIGPKGTSQNSDVWSVFYSKVEVNESQIDRFDDDTGHAFTKYKAFGGAVQKLNDKAKKGNGSAYSVQKGMDEIIAAGAKLTNLGTELLTAYNPAPLALALVDYDSVFTSTAYSSNKLVQIVNGNDTMRGVFDVLGSSFITFGGVVNIPTTYVIAATLAIILLLTSVVLTLANGRSAGENIRKAIVKIFVACVSVPVAAWILNGGINFLNNVSLDLATAPADNYIEQNLNLVDWYTTGFAIPDGCTISIDESGEFVMSPSTVRRINEFTYQKVTGNSPNSEAIMQRMEEYYNLSQAVSMGVSFSEPIRESDRKPWATSNYYKILNSFGSNNTNLLDGIEEDSYNSEGRKPDVANVGYLSCAQLEMTNSGTDGMVYDVKGVGSDYGISPIAATNLMRTTFTGSGMSVNSNATIGGVAFNIDNGRDEDAEHMNVLVRFLALFAIVMAGVKGLFTIITAGFGGVIGGSAKSAMGLSTGFGQAIGGAIALVGGVFGIGIIMTLSFNLLDQIYGVIVDLLSVSNGETSILDPIGEIVSGIPILGPILERPLKGLASFIATFLAAMVLPKFGGIPVTLFCQYLAEIPHRFAAEAQQIENKFTGDFRAGGGGFGHGGGMSSSTLINQATNSAGQQIGQFGKGAATIAGALGGFGLTKAGKWMESHADKKDTESMASNSESSGAENPDALGIEGSQDGTEGSPDATAAQDAAQYDAQQESRDAENGDQEDSLGNGDDKTVAEGDVSNMEQGDTVNGKEEVKEATNNVENTNDSEQSSDSESEADIQQISDQISSEDSMADKDTLMENQSNMENSSDTGEFADQRSSEDSLVDMESATNNSGTEINSSDQQSNQENASSEQFGSESSMSERAMATAYGGAVITSSDRQSAHDRVSANQHLSDRQQANQSNTSSQSTASLRSERNHVSEKSGSMTGSERRRNGSVAATGAAARQNTSQRQSVNPNGRMASGNTGRTGTAAQHNAQRGQFMNAGRNERTGTVSGTSAQRTQAAAGAPSTSPRTPGTDSNRPVSTSPKSEQVNAQRSARRWQIAGRVFQAAGGHTSTSDMVRGVTAGGASAFGSYVGAEGMSQQVLNNHREDQARRRDIRNGVDPALRRQREAARNQNRNTGAANGPGNAQGSMNGRQAQRDAMREAQIAQEELYQQQAEADAARRNPK